MRIAVLSDIHGNAVALEAALTDLPDVDRVVCLGDAVQGGPQPAEVVASLREAGCPVVMGNADAFVLTGSPGAEEAPPSMMEVREWTLSRLSADDIGFMESFVQTVTLPLPGGRDLLCFHGSPGSFDDVILPETPEDEVRQMLGTPGAFAMTGGHTHLQQIRRIGDGLYFNPGSVGLAYDRHAEPESFRFDAWAEYAVLTCDERHVALDLRRVGFDRRTLLDAYSASGMPYAERSASRWAP